MKNLLKPERKTGEENKKIEDQGELLISTPTFSFAWKTDMKKLRLSFFYFFASIV